MIFPMIRAASLGETIRVPSLEEYPPGFPGAGEEYTAVISTQVVTLVDLVEWLREYNLLPAGDRNEIASRLSQAIE